MTQTLEIYINGTTIIVENGIIPMQLVFKNEFGEKTGHSFLTVNQMEKLLSAKTGHGLTWGDNELKIMHSLVAEK
jgi:hypothetical protein